MKVIIHLNRNASSFFYMTSKATQEKTVSTFLYIDFRTKVSIALRQLIHSTPVFNTLYDSGDLESFKALMIVNNIEFEEVTSWARNEVKDT